MAARDEILALIKQSLLICVIEVTHSPLPLQKSIIYQHAKALSVPVVSIALIVFFYMDHCFGVWLKMLSKVKSNAGETFPVLNSDFCVGFFS